jgi:HEAT repeat protein
LEVSALKKNPRSKNPCFSEEMIQACLETMGAGSAEELFEILPRIGVLRDSRFGKPLLQLLQQKGDLKRREFAAYALAALGAREFLEPLKKAFLETRDSRGAAARDFQMAAIEAIGALGDDAAAEFFLPILSEGQPGKESARLHRCIIESLGALAQQGGGRSLEVLLSLTRKGNPELRALALSELAVAYWHRPNEIDQTTLQRIVELTNDRSAIVAETALAALESLADVGCRRAERLFKK